MLPDPHRIFERKLCWPPPLIFWSLLRPCKLDHISFEMSQEQKSAGICISNSAYSNVMVSLLFQSRTVNIFQVSCSSNCISSSYYSTIGLKVEQMDEVTEYCSNSTYSFVKISSSTLYLSKPPPPILRNFEKEITGKFLPVTEQHVLHCWT